MVKKEIKATASKLGIYTEILEKGAGTIALRGMKLRMEVVLTSLAGVKLNSTRDPKSKGPVEFILGSGYFPSSIEDHIVGIAEGSKFRLYIPGALLFGAEESHSNNVKPEDSWIFDLELLSVK